jgi:HAD superfamily hydrolase (TIGR01484 family)
MTKIRLVALDLDGTTLSTKHEVSDRTKAVLQRLSDKGVTIVLATGRSPPCVTKYFEVLELSQASWPGVSYNGACGTVWSAKVGDDGVRSKVNVFLNPVPADGTIKLIDFAKEMGAVAQV